MRCYDLVKIDVGYLPVLFAIMEVVLSRCEILQFGAPKVRSYLLYPFAALPCCLPAVKDFICQIT